MDRTAKGTLAPLQQSYSEHFDPENGTTRRIVWRGASEAAVRAYAASYARNKVGYDLTIINEVAELSVNDTTGNATIDTWQICQNELQKSQLQNPRHDASGGAIPISATNLLTIADMEDTLTYAQAKAKITAAGGATMAASLRLLDRMRLGSTDFVQSGYVLRHTTNVSNRYNANVSDFNIDKIYTTSQLLSEAQSSAFWLFPLPGRLAYKIQNIDSPPSVSNYLWGWLKRGSTETTAANNRVDIVTEYWLDQWSTDEYGTV